MDIRDVRWADPVNLLLVECDCGTDLTHPTNYSLCRCPHCGRVEMWHGVQPEAPGSGWFSHPVMRMGGE